MKPPTWKDCPIPVLERLLEDLDLDYDSYEGSKVEKINDILNGSCSGINEKIIQSAWNVLSEVDFELRCRQVVDEYQRQIEEIKVVLGDKIPW